MQERKVFIGRGGVMAFLVASMVIVVFLIGTCGIAMANESPPDAIPLLQGQTAPFDGVLLPAETLELLLKAKVDVERLDAELKASQKELDLTVRLYEDRIHRLAAELDPGFWKQADIQRWIGFASGVIFTGFSVWGAGQLDR